MRAPVVRCDPMPDDVGSPQEDVPEVAAIVLPPADAVLERRQAPAGSSYADPVGAYLLTLSTEKSRRTAVECLRRVARALGVQKGPRDYDAWRRVPWTALTYAETNMVRTQLVANTKPATARLTVTVLRQVLHQAFQLRLIGADQCMRAMKLAPIKGQSARPGRELKAEDMKQLEQHFETLEEPYRQMVRALFAVGIGGGLRRAELAHLLVAGVESDTLRFIGKGQKDAVQRLEPWAHVVLGEWLAARQAAGYTAATVFLRYDRAGEVLMDAPMDPGQVWELVRAQWKAAGIKKISPHDLRRTFGTRIFREKNDPIVAKAAMRHAKLSTTELYDRRSEDELAGAMATMKPMMKGAADGSTGRAEVQRRRDGRVFRVSGGDNVRPDQDGRLRGTEKTEVRGARLPGCVPGGQPSEARRQDVPDRFVQGQEHGRDDAPLAGDAARVGEHWRAFRAWVAQQEKGKGKNAKSATAPWVEAFLKTYPGDREAARAEIGAVLEDYRKTRPARS